MVVEDGIDERQKMGGEDDNRVRRNPNPSLPNRRYSAEDIIVLGSIGATVIIYAIRDTALVRRNASWLYTQWIRAKSGKTGGPSRSAFNEEAWKRYKHHTQEAYEEEVERIKRMENMFNREWEDWHRKNHQTNYRETPRASASSPLSHHYSVLGLDRLRKTPYTEAEIKTAFRTKAKEFHPDQNQKNKVAAEAKFREVMTSYEAIKQDRKDIKF